VKKRNSIFHTTTAQVINWVIEEKSLTIGSISSILGHPLEKNHQNRFYGLRKTSMIFISQEKSSK